MKENAKVVYNLTIGRTMGRNLSCVVKQKANNYIAKIVPPFIKTLAVYSTYCY